MPDKYLRRDSASGQLAETIARDASAGASDAGKVVALDVAGRLDQSMMPVGIGQDVFSGTASGSLSAGDFVYVKGDSTIARASAGVGGNQAQGFVLSASASGAPATVFFEGRNTAVSGLTVGVRYYLSDATPGGLTSTPVGGAGKLHQFIGKAVTSTSFDFEPDDAIILA